MAKKMRKFGQNVTYLALIFDRPARRSAFLTDLRRAGAPSRFKSNYVPTLSLDRSLFD